MRSLPVCRSLLVAGWFMAAVPAGAAEMGRDLLWPERDAPMLLPSPASAAGKPWLTRLQVPGPEALAAATPAVDRWSRAGHRLVLTADPAMPLPPAGDVPAADAWADAWAEGAGALDKAVIAMAPLWLGGEPDSAWQLYLMKRVSVALRGARPDLQVGLLAGAGSGEALRQAYAGGDLAAYVDLWLVASAAPEGEPLAALQDLRRELHPAAAVWRVGVQPADTAPSAGAVAWARAATDGAGAVTLRLANHGQAASLAQLRAAVPATATPQSGVAPRLLTWAGEERTDVQTWSFFDAATDQSFWLMVPGPGLSPAPLQVVLPTFDVAGPRLRQLQGGTTLELEEGLRNRVANSTTLSLEALSGPVVLSCARFASTGTAREQVEVAGTRMPTVEEILARHQQADAAGKARLETVLADARIEFHYTIAGSGTTFDVAYDSLYLWSPETGAEYEYRTLFINGSRWTRRRMPDLPLIQPEKVVMPPLRINLGRQYRYRLEGEERLDGRPAWRIAFTPRDAAAARYRGTAWIDQETHRLVRQAVVQTGLEPPVQASEEVSRLATFAVPGGGEVALPVSMKGQQQWTVGGANFIVNREVRFNNVRLNDPSFASLRDEAYASGNQMLRDTDRGLRYLEPDGEGGRQVQEVLRTRSLFLLGGGFYNEAVERPIPFAGVDYFDYDFRNSGQQVNFFLAGAANFLTWADPALGDSRLDLAANLGLVGFASSDRYYLDGVEQEEAQVKSRGQSLSLTLGAPLGRFGKFRGHYGLAYENYQRGEDMAPDFIVPRDTLIQSVSLEVQLNRRGFTATLAGTRLWRQDWQPWGDPDPDSLLVGSRLIDFDTRFTDYFQWYAGLSQDLFLRAFQKVRLSATWLDGSDLDRFSRYQFSFFGERRRLRGFSGSGLRFDRGLLARARYTFNVADRVSFDGGVDHGVVEDQVAGDGFQQHTGIGFAARFVGPWGLILRVEYGYALRSEVAATEGEHEGQLLFLKIF